MGAAAQPPQDSDSIFEIRGLAEDLTIDDYQGIGSENDRIRRRLRDWRRFAGSVPDRQLADREPGVRHFVDQRRDDLELITRFPQ
jgi:hypothetical protein